MFKVGDIFQHSISRFLKNTLAICCVCDRDVVIYDFVYKQFYHYDRAFAEANFRLCQ